MNYEPIIVPFKEGTFCIIMKKILIVFTLVATGIFYSFELSNDDFMEQRRPIKEIHRLFSEDLQELIILIDEADETLEALQEKEKEIQDLTVPGLRVGGGARAKTHTDTHLDTHENWLMVYQG